MARPICAIDGRLTTRKDVLVEEAAATILGSAHTNRMHERVAAVGQPGADDLEEAAVVPMADVLQAPDRHHAIERAADIAVVLDAQLHRQPGGPRRSERRLFARERDAGAPTLRSARPRTWQTRPIRSRYRARACPARASACGRRDRASPPAPPPASALRRASTRRCTPCSACRASPRTGRCRGCSVAPRRGAPCAASAG